MGGEILDDVLTCLARGARIAICGAISQYNETQVRGPANYMMLLVARASMTGLLVFDYADRYPEAMAETGRLVRRRAARRAARPSCTAASRISPDTLLKLFEGANTGKLILAL